MPNWLHILFNGLYHLGLALWIGGAVALGALTAPALFKALPRRDAGAIFGPILRRFAYLRLAAVALIVIGAALKFLMFETHAATPWILLRWLMIAFLAAVVLYEIGSMHPRMQALREQGLEGTRADEFGRLHKRAEALMKSSLVAAVIALFLS